MATFKYAIGDTVISKLRTPHGINTKGESVYVHREGVVTKQMEFPTRYEVTFPDGSKADLQEGELAPLRKE